MKEQIKNYLSLFAGEDLTPEDIEYIAKLLEAVYGGTNQDGIPAALLSQDFRDGLLSSLKGGAMPRAQRTG